MLNPSSNYDRSDRFLLCSLLLFVADLVLHLLLSRSSSATAYFSPVEESRTNWLVLTQYQVTELIWSSDDSSEGKRATGVHFKADYAGTKVLLSRESGSLISPLGNDSC